MQQFSLYQNQSDHNHAYPFLVDIQNDLLQSLTTRLLIPLTPRHLFHGKVPTSLCPLVQLEQGEFILMTQYMSSIPASTLTSPVGSLEAFRTPIIQAVDLLITGV